MVLGGLRHQGVVVLDCRAILASVLAVWVVPGGLLRQWVGMLNSRVIFAPL